jgi:hypothetical protein
MDNRNRMCRSLLLAASSVPTITLAIAAVGCSDGGATIHEDTAAQGSSLNIAASDAPTDEVIKIQRYLDSIYLRDDVRHSFRTVFNEDVDCIDFEAQPSVKNLRAHGLPVMTEPPQIDVSRPTGSGVSSLLAKVALNGAPDENGSARSCPAGTVPYPRTTVDEVLRMGGLSAYLNDRAKPRAPMAPPPGPGSPCPTRPASNTPPYFNWVYNDYFVNN